MKKKFEIREHGQGVFDVCATNDGRIFTCSADGYVVSWDVLTGKQNPFVIRTSVPAYALACSENLLFVGLNNGDLHWIDLQTKQEIKFFTQHKSPIFRLLFIPEINKLVSTDADGYLGVWDCEKLQLDLFFQIPCGKIRSIAFNEKSQELLIGGQNGIVYQFETAFFNQINQFYAHQDGVTALCFHPNGTLLVSGGKDAHLRVWNSKNGEKIKAFPAHLYAIYKIVFSPDGKLMATCSRDKNIKIWNAEDFSIIQKLDFKAGGHQHSVNSIIWTESGLISVSDDRRIILWEE